MFLYNIVDGIFIGQGVGSAALGAVNIAVPFMTAAVALVSMMPMGGATIIAIRTGQGDKAGANQAFMSALTLTVLLSVIMTVIGMVFAKEIVLLCGGRNLSHEMVAMAEEYLFYFMAFCIFNLMSLSLSVLSATMDHPHCLLWPCVPVRLPTSFLTGCLSSRYSGV